MSRAMHMSEDIYNERVAMPYGRHLQTAQEEVDIMVSDAPAAEEEGVYDKPKQSVKFLKIAQKALNKVT